MTNHLLPVTIKGANFQGFLLQARKPGSTKALGKFSYSGDKARVFSCTSSDSAFTHNNQNSKNNVVATWTPPCGDEGTIEFV